jgi:poly-gamma-glutamate synthesis protein (capsule biosynthesis protein)
MVGTTIRKGDRTSVVLTLDDRDEREILDQIKAARQPAEIVIVSVHRHEPTNASDAPAEFFRRFAHAAIDAGAHALVGHGPHRLRGIEVYHDGAIFFSLGNFPYQTKDVDAGANAFDAGTDLYAPALGADARATREQTGTSACSSVIGLLTFENAVLTSDPCAADTFM